MKIIVPVAVGEEICEYVIKIVFLINQSYPVILLASSATSASSSPSTRSGRFSSFIYKRVTSD